MKSSLVRADDGATAVEYSFLVAFVASIIVGIVVAVGSATEGSFRKTCDAMARDGGIVHTAGDC